jgi:hypothetical protein
MSATRERFNWKVTLQASDGEIVEYPFSAHWSPEVEGTADAVGNAAAAQAWHEGGKQRSFHPIAAALA